MNTTEHDLQNAIGDALAQGTTLPEHVAAWLASALVLSEEAGKVALGIALHVALLKLDGDDLVCDLSPKLRDGLCLSASRLLSALGQLKEAGFLKAMKVEGQRVTVEIALAA